MTPARDIHSLYSEVKIVLLGGAERPAEREELSDDLPPIVLGINPGLSRINDLFCHDSKHYRNCRESAVRRADPFSEVAEAMFLAVTFLAAAHGMEGTDVRKSRPGGENLTGAA